MGGGRDAGASAKDDLRGHEFAVVLAEGSGKGLVAGVAGVAAGGPLPYVAEELLEAFGAGCRGGMKVGRFEEVAGDGLAGGGVFPLELGGEAVAGPAGVGVGLEEAEVADGGFAEVVERDEAVESVDGPAGLGGGVALPIERGLPALGVDGGPAFGEPELGTVVAVLVDEGEVFGAGDEAGGEAE